MNRENISEEVKRRIYAESMGRCMNPACQEELFKSDGDIIEKAHIVPYSSTADNSYENLIILCPNCHTNFDKNGAFKEEEVRKWKAIRQAELSRLFSKKFKTFNELKKEVYPLLMQNKAIYENYFLGNQKELWDKFEGILLVNNRKIKTLLEKNLDLIQSHENKAYSNLEFIYEFFAHIDEFELTRTDKEKHRCVLYPNEINSMFGVSPVKERLLPSTESLEAFIREMQKQGKFKTIELGIEEPYIVIFEDEKDEKILLEDSPRLRQLYYNSGSFRATKVRLDSLNYVLKVLRTRGISFEYKYTDNLRCVIVNGVCLVFVYEYCLSKVILMEMHPESGSVIVNLHNWNGDGCISKEAYRFSSKIGVKLLTMKDFFGYLNALRND